MINLKIENKNIKFLKTHTTYLVMLVVFLISFSFFIHFFSNHQNLYFADSMSRLDISRKVLDNLNPGLPQLGNVWLPLPQVIMLPFIWNNYLWHTGIAGSITSMLMFLLTCYFVYKSAYLITKSRIASVLSLSIFALNINILYLQTTAMSESLFLCTVAGTIYYFLKWFKSGNRMYLVPAAAIMAAMTLTRYEGLAMLLASVPMIYFYTLIEKRSFTKAEGNVFLYVALAFLGFGLWTLYLWVIFGDPLYWKDYYATPQATGGLIVYTQQKSFLAAVWEYLTSCVWMIGLIPVGMSIIGILALGLYSIKKQSLIFLPMLLPLSLFLFMVLTLQRNTPVIQPDLSINNFADPKTNGATDFNIRYGILLLPWVAIIIAFIFRLFKYTHWSVRAAVYTIFVLLFSLQVISYYQPKYTIIYQLPYTYYGKPYTDIVDFMKQNYDGGKILISATGFEDQMFLMGYDYRTYVHEGAGKYWKESLDAPAKYNTWIILDTGHPEDGLIKPIFGTQKLWDYNIVYHKDSKYIYKIKTKPWIQIN